MGHHTTAANKFLLFARFFRAAAARAQTHYCSVCFHRSSRFRAALVPALAAAKRHHHQHHRRRCCCCCCRQLQCRTKPEKNYKSTQNLSFQARRSPGHRHVEPAVLPPNPPPHHHHHPHA